MGYGTYVGSYLKSLTKGGDPQSLGEGCACVACTMCVGPTSTVSGHLTTNKSTFSTFWWWRECLRQIQNTETPTVGFNSQTKASKPRYLLASWGSPDKVY